MTVSAVVLRDCGTRSCENQQRLSENSPWQSAEGVCPRSFGFFPFCQRGGCWPDVRPAEPYAAARMSERIPCGGDTYSGRNGKAVQSGLETSGRTSYGTARTSEALG